MRKKVGLILAGCGFYDGTDTSEAIFTLLALDKYDCEAICLAPDEAQSSVVNHLSGEEQSQTRSIREEAARLTRSKVLSLNNFEAQDLEALVIPGGFGVSKNLIANEAVFQDFKKIVWQMHQASKPLAAICLSPTILAKALLEMGIETELENLQNQNAAQSKIIAEHGILDRKHKVITSPCYTPEASIAQIYLGIENTIIKLTQLCHS